ncbi:MAG TPA: hypothetical protein VER76_00365 [Pyrinomonadaceae bacterium]|nr:hypothetical protein [Pyrinomonadaceae bacterium]
MWVTRKFNSFLILLSLFVVSTGATAFTGGASVATGSTAPQSDDAQMIQPSDIFQNFPELKWGMSFKDARKAIEKTGVSPVGFKNYETELAWDAEFNNMRGRGGVHFREGAGLSEIVVGVYAFEKQKEVFEAWQKKIVERHGAANESSDTEVSVSKVWRLKNKFVIELRSLKDVNSPVVDVHWVKE